MNDLFGVYHADAYDTLKRLCPDSVDAVITDPPYGTTQMEWDTAAQWDRLWPLIKEVLKGAGVVVSFSAQPYTTDLIKSNRDWWRYEIIWAKTMGTRFLDANDRPLQGHENIQVFTAKMKKSTYNAQKTNGDAYKSYSGTKGEHYADFELEEGEKDGARHPLTVQEFGNGNNRDQLHPSEKPVDLMRWLVRTYTNEGDHVLDPFCGAGSTGVAALRERRTFTGIEKDEEYAKKARSRCRATASQNSLF